MQATLPCVYPLLHWTLTPFLSLSLHSLVLPGIEAKPKFEARKETAAGGAKRLGGVTADSASGGAPKWGGDDELEGLDD